MKLSTLNLITLTAALTGSVSAQNYISGTVKCGKPDISQPPIEVGDRASHVLMVMKMTCRYITPAQLAGLKLTTESVAELTEIVGGKFQDRGYVVIATENGDKAYAHTQDTGIMKEGGAFTDRGTWTITDGTGKLRGIKGKGTYKSSGSSEGEVSQMEGEYSLPPLSAVSAKE